MKRIISKTTLAALALALVLVGSVTVVGTMQLAHATNESPYKWGYQDGFNEYKQYIKYSGDADILDSNIPDACQVYHNSVLISCYSF